MNQTQPNIILASTSPRRHALLKQVNIAFDVGVVAIDETPKIHNGCIEDAITYVQRMAVEKNQAAQQAYDKENIIITADTIGRIMVNTQEHILVKPKNYEDAKRMWTLMSGRTHDVITSVGVSFNQHFLQATVTTQVEFIELTNEKMQQYWLSNEPADKAGAYAIQGIGAAWVKSIHGSYANVVGLPVVETIELINHIQTM